LPEHIGMDEAKDIVKRPRQGAVIRSFTRTRFFPEVDTREPEAKKSKRASAEDPGKESFYLSFYLFFNYTVHICWQKFSEHTIFL
jgi:hypothetical protein